jgi:sugar lactone lactonase YvrE
MLGALALTAAIPVAEAAPTPAAGWAVTEFATGFANNGTSGPLGIAFDKSGNVYISDSVDGFIYRFPRAGVPAGGWKVSSSTRFNSTAYSTIAWGLAFGKDGRFYINRPTNSSGETDEISILDGKILRVVQSRRLPCPSQLSTDPLSGDLRTDST